MMTRRETVELTIVIARTAREAWRDEAIQQRKPGLLRYARNDGGSAAARHLVSGTLGSAGVAGPAGPGGNVVGEISPLVPGWSMSERGAR